MTTQLTKEQLLRFIESVDDVLSAQAGTNEDVHPESDDMIRLWDYLNDVAAPPAPVVPDERYQHLSDLYHAQEKRLFKLAQRIKGPSFDKYTYSPSQAIDVLEAAIFGESAEEDCRAAMFNQEKSNG